MNKEALDALIATLDSWAALFTLLVVIGVGGELVVHVMSSRANKKLIAFQKSEALAQEEEIARLKNDSASFELNIATANRGAADANERAAKLEVEALQLRKELLSQGHRANLITGENRKKLVDALKSFASQPIDVRYRASVTQVNGRNIQAIAIGDDTFGLANSLLGVVKDAGWLAPTKPIPSHLSGEGITIEIGDKASNHARSAASALAEALRRVPLAVQGPSQPLPPQLRNRVGSDPVEPPLVDDTIVVDVLSHP